MVALSRPPQASSSVILSAFDAALFHQLLLVLAVVLALALIFNAIRTGQSRRLVGIGNRVFPGTSPGPDPEPASRRTLRIGFGLLWIFDGLLQLQSSIPSSLPSSVMRPAASASPRWVQHLVNSGATVWSHHPVEAAAAVVWIQVGLGIWILVAPRGRWSRLGALASIGWGLVVWVFGEAFGSVFAPGLTWLSGAPGAALLYCSAGFLLALPDRTFGTPRLGRIMLGVTGSFFITMAVLQAWPGRGFWQGQGRGMSSAGTLTEIVRHISHTPQPAIFSSWISAFASVDSAHGWGVNLVVVFGLGSIGIAFVSGRPRAVRWAVAGAVAICLADWVLIEDLGFFGGVGTDPDSMIPMVLLVVAGFLASVRLPVMTEPLSEDQVVSTGATVLRGDRRNPTVGFRTVATLGAVVIVIIGVVPIILASVNPNADPILAVAFAGVPSLTNAPAPPFTLVDQHNDPVSLSSLRGRTVALTFLDPVCSSDCPLIAQEFRQTDAMLGAEARRVDFIAIVANPIYRSTAFTTAFDRREGLAGVSNWFFLTGSRSALEEVWIDYGAEVYTTAPGAMIAHSNIAFVIDGRSHTRVIMGQDQDPETAPESSFSVLLADQIKRVLNS